MARSDKKVLDEKDIKKLETMAGFGMTITQMAAIFDMSKPTLERRIAENNGDNPVNDALLKGRAKTSYNIRKTAYHLAVNKKNVTMLIFWLKCREGWKDKDFFDNEDDEGEYPNVE